MFRIMVILMIVVPALEIWGIVKTSQWIGGWSTLLLILSTGFIGAFLAKKEGLKTLHLAQKQYAQGQIPGQAILDGICIFAGGLLLMTPGFFTDFLGFILVLPWTRMFFKLLLMKWIRDQIERGRLHLFFKR